MSQHTYSREERMHHYLAIELNMQTWNLLEKTVRTDQDNQRMMQFAYGSLYHWQHSPHHQPVNDQRGEWMLSRVFAVLGDGESALKHAEECYSLTQKHKLDGFDLAYAYEALARAYALLKDVEKARHYYSGAVSASERIEKSDDRDLFISDLRSEPWFNFRLEP